MQLSRFSHVRFFATLWTRAHQAPLSMEFSRPKYWTGLLLPLPEDLPNPGIELVSLMSHAWQTGSLPLASPGKPGIGLCLTVFPEIRKQEGFEAAEARVG